MDYEQAYQWLHGDRAEYSGCRAAAEAMEAEVMALRKDAERYRKLRALHWTDNKLIVVHPGSVLLGCNTFSGPRLDEQVDALPAAGDA